MSVAGVTSTNLLSSETAAAMLNTDGPESTTPRADARAAKLERLETERETKRFNKAVADSDRDSYQNYEPQGTVQFGQGRRYTTQYYA